MFSHEDTKPFGREPFGCEPFDSEPFSPELKAEGLRVERLKAERALRLQNYSFNTLLDEGHIKIDKKTKTFAGQF